MATTTNLDSLVINYLTQAQYDAAAQAGTLNANQLYLTPDTGGPTGTLSSVGVSNATNGGLTVSGSPLTSDGTITIGHSNVLSSAQTTQAVYPIKIDKNGHISEYGSAVTISDTKVTQTPLNGSTATQGLLMGRSTGTDEITSTTFTTNKIQWNDANRSLYIYNDTRAKNSIFNYNYVSIADSNSTYQGYFKTNTLTATRNWYFPDQEGTVALTTDIPTVPTKVSDLTNDSGFITSDSDQKLVTNQSQNTTTQYYPIFGENSTTASTKLYNSNFRVQYYNSVLTLQLGQKSSSPTQGKLTLVSNQANASTSLLTNATSDRTYTLPDKTGTVALTSDIPTVPTNISAFTNDSGFITSADVPEGASAYTGTISAVGTTASNGTSNGFARGDHVHNITSTTITSALGYTPYNSTNPNGYISSYTDENMKWTASTSSNTYYPLQSTSTATTSTANTLNSVSFYQYYNTAGGYRRLILGNSTAYTSTGGAYGTIRLYGTDATYYGDLNPGTVGANSLTANRTWTLPNATGTIALTSDIPSVPTSAASKTTGITATTTANKTTVGSSSTDYGVTAAGSGSFSATVTSHVLSFSHGHTAPTLGSKVPTVSTTSATVTITDNGHTHTLS